MPADAAAPAPGRPIRVGLVAQHPIHYHLPLYRALDADPEVELEVLYAQKASSSSGYDPEVSAVVDWGLPMFEGYRYELFPNLSPRRDGAGFWKFVNPGLIRRVLAGPHDAIYVHGHNHFTHVAAIAAARLGGKRVIVRTISNNLGERPAHVRLIRRLLYRALHRLAHVLLHTGEHNRRFFEDFGARPRQLVHAPHVVDNARFDAERARLAPRRGALKEAFGIGADRKVVLWCGKFRAIKQPLMLVDAFLDAALGDEWVLLMVGEGALREACEARAVERGAAAERGAATGRDAAAGRDAATGRGATAGRSAGRVVFAGFLDQNEVGRGYAVADVMVLPSIHETWGLVVNEAMNFGCPVIVSDRVGCAPDLVAGKCGLVFPHDRPEALVAALRRMAGDDDFRARCRARARAVIAAWSVREYLAGMRRALGLPEGPPA